MTLPMIVLTPDSSGVVPGEILDVILSERADQPVLSELAQGRIGAGAPSP